MAMTDGVCPRAYASFAPQAGESVKVRRRRGAGVLHFIIATLLIGEAAFLYFAGIELQGGFLLALIAFHISIIAALLFAGAFGLLCVLLAWLPFDLSALKYEIGVVTLTPYTFGMLCLVLSVPFRALRPGHSPLIAVPDFPLAGICLVYFLGLALAEDLVDSGYLAFHAIFVPMVTYLVIKSVVHTDDELRVLARFMLFGAAAIGLFSVVDFLTSGLERRVDVLGRDSIAIATFAAFLLCSAAAGVGVRSRWIRAALCLIACASLAVTFSRAYIAILLMAPFVYVLIRRGWTLGLLIALLASSLLVTLALTLNPDVVKPVGYELRYENTLERLTNPEYWKAGLYTRLESFHVGLEGFLQNPWIGESFNREEGAGSTTHNVHIEWLQYGGVLGYLFCAAFFVSVFARAAPFAKLDRFTACCLVMLLVLLVNGLTNGFMHGVMPYVAFVLLGLIEARVRLLRMARRLELNRASEVGSGFLAATPQTAQP